MRKLEGKKVLMVIANQNFRDEEYLEPRFIMERAGAEITVAAQSTDEASGMLGAKAQPDMALPDAKVDDYDGVVFVGGSGANVYWEDGTAHALAKAANESGKIVAAICIAPVTLLNAGLLNQKKATVFESEVDKLTAKGVEYTGKKVERDGNIITGSGPDAAADFGDALVDALAEKK